MIQHDGLIGAWGLVSMKAQKPDGEVVYPYDENPFGILIYTASGHMSVLLMRLSRPKFGSANPLAGTTEEIKAAYEGFDAYCGTYTVDEENGVITHHVKGSKFPNWVGTDQVRPFKLSGDQLLISGPLTVGVESWDFEVVWERL